jgi:hypothetical protein
MSKLNPAKAGSNKTQNPNCPKEKSLTSTYLALICSPQYWVDPIVSFAQEKLWSLRSRATAVNPSCSRNKEFSSLLRDWKFEFGFGNWDFSSMESGVRR